MGFFFEFCGLLIFFLVNIIVEPFINQKNNHFRTKTDHKRVRKLIWINILHTDATRMEIMELKNHPFYAAVQYHPEYLSRPMRPSPPYLGLILAATGKLEAFIAKGQEFSEANFLILISSPKTRFFFLISALWV